MQPEHQDNSLHIQGVTRYSRCAMSLNLVGDHRINRGRSRNGAGPDPDERRFCFPDRHVGGRSTSPGSVPFLLRPGPNRVCRREVLLGALLRQMDAMELYFVVIAHRHASARRARDRLLS